VRHEELPAAAAWDPRIQGRGMSAEERLKRAEELNERAARLNERVHAASDPEEVTALLAELEDVAKQTTELLEEIRRDAGT
jgi:hypothetical protein